MKKVAFLSKITSGWKKWSDLLDQFDASRKLDPLDPGKWSIKDIMAHISWHEQEMVRLIQPRKLVGSEWWNLPTDERNEKIYQSTRERSLEDVTAEAGSVHQQLMTSLEQLTDEDLENSSHFVDMPPDWVPWKIIASNTYEHYSQHERDLKRNLETKE